MSQEQPVKSACPHPEAVGTRWGDPISEERQIELRARSAGIGATIHGHRLGPFDVRDLDIYDDERMRLRLTGADVAWLWNWEANQTGRDQLGHVPNLHLEGADLFGAHLEGATLGEAHLEGAVLLGAHLEGADLSEAHLEGADLRAAHLERAKFGDTHLEGANLTGANLAGASLSGAFLVQATLGGATFDKTSQLKDTILTGVSLDQVTFDNVNLTVVDWSVVPVLGDEMTARQARRASDSPFNGDLYDSYKQGEPKSRATRLEEYKAAVRANRVLAVTLRGQGLSEDAERYAYRAQVLQRQLLRRQRHFSAAFGSWLLDAVSGYGYKPIRSAIAYVFIIALFAGAYLLNAQFAAPHLRWDEALVLSISSFHGRGFFTTGISLGDTLARLAAGEAVIGLLIEITFIATFTQRFFAR